MVPVSGAFASGLTEPVQNIAASVSGFSIPGDLTPASVFLVTLLSKTDLHLRRLVSVRTL